MSIVSVVGEIDRCGRAMIALADIERLHNPVTVCIGCHIRECKGDCEGGDREAFYGDPRTVTVCGLCCWDNYDNGRSADCIECHDHEAGGPVCSTAEIIARAGL